MVESWLAWLIIGVLLMVSEVFTGAFFLIFFGAAALVVATINYVSEPSVTTNLLLFAGLGITLVLTIRRKIVRSIRREGSFKPETEVMVSLHLPPGETGTINYQGSPWTATNIGSEALEVHSTAIVERIEGNRLFIRSRGGK